MTIPVLPSLPAGYVATLGDMQALAYAATFALTKPMTKVIDNTGGATIGTSFGTVAFTTAVFDIDGMWNVANPHRLTVQTPGWYSVRYGINCGTVTGVYTTCVASTTGTNNPQGSGVVSGNYWGGMSDEPNSSPGWATGGGDWPFFLYAGDYLQVFIEAAATGSSTGTGTPGSGPNHGGSYFSAELVSI
jgi:hypothetical protein